MRPNLSIESIAGALAVLGTGVLMAACGGPEAPKTPVNSTEVSGATDKASTPADGHCGAGKDHKAGEASCSADHHPGADAKGADPAAAKPADTTPAASTPADAKAATDKTGTPTPAATGTAKKPGAAPATPPAAKKGGSGSCGAGTCGAKK